MPLAKLQRFRQGNHSVEDRFIYEFEWKDEASLGSVKRDDFDDTITFPPHVSTWLVRLAPLVRPLVHAKWAERVAASNPEGLVDAHRLGEFLFGAQRISLDPVRVPLAESQNGRCFYCESKMSDVIEVDHFLPWSSYPDNTLDNLVPPTPHAITRSRQVLLPSSPRALAEEIRHWVRGTGINWSCRHSALAEEAVACSRPVVPPISGFRKEPSLEEGFYIPGGQRRGDQSPLCHGCIGRCSRCSAGNSRPAFTGWPHREGSGCPSCKVSSGDFGPPCHR